MLSGANGWVTTASSARGASRRAARLEPVVATRKRRGRRCRSRRSRPCRRTLRRRHRDGRNRDGVRRNGGRGGSCLVARGFGRGRLRRRRLRRRRLGWRRLAGRSRRGRAWRRRARRLLRRRRWRRLRRLRRGNAGHAAQQDQRRAAQKKVTPVTDRHLGPHHCHSMNGNPPMRLRRRALASDADKTIRRWEVRGPQTARGCARSVRFQAVDRSALRRTEQAPAVPALATRTACRRYG